MHTRAINIHSKPTRKVGFVLKPHGYSGQLRLNTDEDYVPESYLFVSVNDKFVPYEIESYNADANIIKLKGLNTIEQVTELLGLPLLELLEEQDTPSAPDFTGYTLIDTISGHSYSITGIIEYPGNILLEFRHNYTDCLLPMHPDLITDINHETKTVTAQFPEGLLDL